jgi:hypothetical protein
VNPRPTTLDAAGHALSRYIERWHPDVHPRDARLRLEGYFSSADFVEREDGNAQSIWKTSEGALLVVDDHGVVRTVLPRDAAKRR